MRMHVLRGFRAVACRTLIVACAPVLLACALASCGSTRDPPERLTVHGVEARDDTHIALAVTGADFPVGARGSVRIDGMWYGALSAPSRQQRELPCTVSGVGEAVVARDAFAGLALPATFDGRLSVRLDEAPNRPSVEGGPIAAAFAIDGENPEATARVALQREMLIARSTLGLVVELRPGSGLLVTRTAQHGLAASAGIEAGDLLTRLDEKPLLLESALAFPGGAAGAELSYVRGGVTARTRVGTRPGNLNDFGANAWVFALFACGGAFLPTRARSRDDTKHTRALVVVLALACTAALFGSIAGGGLWWLLLAQLPELHRMRAATHRSAALHAVAGAACTTLAAAACVVSWRALPPSGSPFPLAAAPWLWLTLCALTMPQGHEEAGGLAASSAQIIGFAARATLFARAAFGDGFALDSRAAQALLVASAVLLLAAIGAVTPRQLPLWFRGVCGSAGLFFACWMPQLGGATSPALLLTLAVLGVASGHFARTSIVRLRQTPRLAPTSYVDVTPSAQT